MGRGQTGVCYELRGGTGAFKAVVCLFVIIVVVKGRNSRNHGGRKGGLFLCLLRREEDERDCHCLLDFYKWLTWRMSGVLRARR